MIIRLILMLFAVLCISSCATYKISPTDKESYVPCSDGEARVKLHKNDEIIQCVKPQQLCKRHETILIWPNGEYLCHNEYEAAISLLLELSVIIWILTLN